MRSRRDPGVKTAHPRPRIGKAWRVVEQRYQQSTRYHRHVEVRAPLATLNPTGSSDPAQRLHRAHLFSWSRISSARTRTRVVSLRAANRLLRRGRQHNAKTNQAPSLIAHSARAHQTNKQTDKHCRRRQSSICKAPQSSALL